MLRRGWDSNPRNPMRAQRFSRPSPSTARSPLRAAAAHGRIGDGNRWSPWQSLGGGLGRFRRVALIEPPSIGQPAKGGKWRRGRDSNPRRACTLTAFRVQRTRPDYATPPKGVRLPRRTGRPNGGHHGVSSVSSWRRGRDLNPRRACTLTAFPMLRTRPDYATPPRRRCGDRARP